MSTEKIKRKDFFKKITNPLLKEKTLQEVDLPPGDPDPLFEKYSRKSLGDRHYSERMAIPDPNNSGSILERVGNVTTGLNPYTGSWTVWQAAQLLRRTGFGIKKTELEALLGMTVSDAVDSLLNITAPANPSPTPLNYYQNTIPDSGGIAFGNSWTANNLTYVNANDDTNNYYRQLSLTSWSWGLCLNENTTIREKMAMFWYHFIPINFDDIRNQQRNSATMCNDYMNLLRTNALGDFKVLIKAIAKTPAMLVFLGNQYSTATVPNENFARELMELFMLGKVPTQNYTEADVIAASKVFSGWRVASFSTSYPFTPAFNSSYHNQTNKIFSSNFGPTTIANQSGANGANEFDIFFDMMFTYQQNTIARYICRRLYRFFVYYDIDANIEANVIVPLAAFMVSNNFQMLPVLKKLFKSEHFFDAANKGVMIKSPLDFIVGTLRTLNISTTPPVSATQLTNQYNVWNYFQNYAMNNLDQGYGMVPNVSGWKAYYQEPAYYQNWINANAIQKRASLLTSFVSGFTTNSTSVKIDAIAFVQQFPTATVQDPDMLIDLFIQYLLPVDLPAVFKSDTKIATLLAGQVTNSYWTTAWNTYVGNPSTANANIVRTRLNSLLTTILQLAEYQLM